jgi:hypothetical protein
LQLGEGEGRAEEWVRRTGKEGKRKRGTERGAPSAAGFCSGLA